MSEDDLVSDITLMLMYLTSWEEKSPLGTARRCWKGYDFDVLNRLQEDDLISGSRAAKSVFLSDEAVAKAEELLASWRQASTAGSDRVND